LGYGIAEGIEDVCILYFKLFWYNMRTIYCIIVECHISCFVECHISCFV
jgi:hypothetical protein